eukprot:359590-Chlamydomonas_euryale.AAC.1
MVGAPGCRQAHASVNDGAKAGARLLLVGRVPEVDLEHVRARMVLWQRDVDALVKPPADGLAGMRMATSARVRKAGNKRTREESGQQAHA